MGIGFVFLIYLFVLAMLTVPAIVVCAGIGYFLARKKDRRTIKTFVVGGGLIPIAGATYILGCIVFMAILGVATGHDVGFGDGFDLPLHNHYHWSAIDTTESACVYDVRDSRATDGEGGTHIEPDNRDAFSNVLKFQEDGDWIAGAYGPYDGRFDSPRTEQVADHWFLFNTRTHQRIDAKNEDELKALADQDGVQLHLQSSEGFYSSHRMAWFEILIVLILLALPIVGLVFLWRTARRFLTTSSALP